MENQSSELSVMLDAFREHLLAEDTSRHTMTAYLSDVPLNADARAAIRDYMSVRPATQEQTLLVGQRKEPLSAHAIYDLVAKYANQAGLEEVTPHTLRHTFARTLISQGVPLSDVADLLGHSSLDTTRIYTKANEGDLQAVVARLEMR